MTRPTIVQVRVPRDLWERIKEIAEAETERTGLKRTALAQLISLLRQALKDTRPE